MTKTKVISLRVHEDTINSFDQKIEETFGSTRQYKKQVIEDLMRSYIEGDPQQQMLEETQKQLEDSQQQLKYMNDNYQQTKEELETYKQWYNDIHQRLEKTEEAMERERQRYEERITKLEKEKTKLEKEKTKYENKRDHEKERRDKLQKEYNELQTKMEKYSYVFGAVTNMPLWKRLLGIYPEEIKELQPPKEENEDFTQQARKE